MFVSRNIFILFKVDGPVLFSIPVIVILHLKFDKVLKNSFNCSILQQLIVRLSNMDYKKLYKSMIIQ